MRQEFITIIDNLKTDPLYGIQVFDLSNGVNAITKKLDKVALEQTYGTVENFFENVFENDVTEILVKIWRKNGTSNNGKTQNWQEKGFLRIKANPDLTPVNSNLPVVDQPSFFQQQQPYLNAPIMSDGGKLAIPIAEYNNLTIDQREKQRLEKDYFELKEKYSRLRKKYKKLERDELLEIRDIEKAKVRNEGLQNGLKEAAPLLGPLMAKLLNNGNVSPAGSALAEPRLHLSDVKNSLITQIEILPDENASMLMYVLQGSNNDQFVKELAELMLKHELITQ